MTESRLQACGSMRLTTRSRCGAASVAGTTRPPRAASTTAPSDQRPPTPCGWTRTTRTPSSACGATAAPKLRSEEHTSELQSHHDLVCRLLLEKKKQMNYTLDSPLT